MGAVFGGGLSRQGRPVTRMSLGRFRFVPSLLKGLAVHSAVQSCERTNPASLVSDDDLFLARHGSGLAKHDLAAETLLLDHPTFALPFFVP
jgi:hypothetical protein